MKTRAEIQAMAAEKFKPDNKYTFDPAYWKQEGYVAGFLDRQEQEQWIDVNVDPPKYYETILVHCAVGFRLAWRASDGEKDFYTKMGGNEILPDVTHYKKLTPPTTKAE